MQSNSTSPSVPVVSDGSLSPGGLTGLATSSDSLLLTPDERQLFCSLTVGALKQIAEEKRNQSQEKKEELRQLVGIRYRVLIETADSIMEMEELIEKSQIKYEEIQTLLPKMSLTNLHIDTTTTPPSQLQLLLMLRSYALAPITIWTYLDGNDYESALTLYLTMKGMEQRLQSIPSWTNESEKDHTELKRLVDQAMQTHATATTTTSNTNNSTATTNAPSPSIAAALSSFFRQHASYYLEIPSIISWVASKRLQQRALRTKSYASTLAALAICSTSNESIGAYLVDQFLASKQKQIHDLLWSAEQSLNAFVGDASSSTSRRPQNPSPILEHCCTQVLIILQHTLLDVAMLFTSIRSDINTHVLDVNLSTTLMEEWQHANVSERIVGLQNHMATIMMTQTTMNKGTSRPSVTQASPSSSFTLPSAVLSSRVRNWLQTISSHVHRLLSTTLLPHLTRTKTKPCQKFARLRLQILKVANWENILSDTREEEDTPAVTTPEEEAEEKKMTEQENHTKIDIENQHATSPRSPSGVDDLRRKALKQRWHDACTLIFGRNTSGVTSVGTNVTAVGDSSMIDLFDLLFFEPFRAHTQLLLTRTFERCTLVTKVEEYLKRRGNGEEEMATTAEEVARQKAKRRKNLLLVGEEDDDDDNKSVDDVKRPSLDDDKKSSLDPTTPLELHGSREDEVQEIVRSFQRQLYQLASECGAMLEGEKRTKENSATSASLAAYASQQSQTQTQSQPRNFSNLQRYLDDELTPMLKKKYNQLVEKLIEQLKKKLTDLEQSVMLSMSDVRSWRSRSTLSLVEQSVFIGRICHQLLKQKHLMTLDNVLETIHATKTNPHALTPPSASSSVPTPLPSSLASTARSAVRIWTRYLAARLSEDFVEELDKQIEQWGTMHDKGEKVEAQYWKQMGSNRNHSGPTPLGLYLPVHCSPCISHLLFDLHGHYYRSFGYHVQPEILTWLLEDVIQGILNVFETKVGEKGQDKGEGDKILTRMAPQAVMQLMFDVQYLFAVTRLPTSVASASGGGVAGGIGSSSLKISVSSPLSVGSDPRSRYGRLLHAFESHLSTSLDQIDWMTSKSSFVTNLHAGVGRASMLYGVLCKANPFPSTLPSNASLATPATTTTTMPSSMVASGTLDLTSSTLPTNMMPLAPTPMKIIPLPTSLYPSKHPHVNPTSTSSTLTRSIIHPTTAAAAHAASSSIAAAVSAAAATPAAPPKSEGLSFSNLSSNLTNQLSLANSSAAANAKTIGDIGSTLLGKLSANSLWGSKKQ